MNKKTLLSLLPFFCIVLLFFTALIVRFLAYQSTAFADTFNSSLAAGLRAALAAVTGLLPFSLAEILIILIPLWLFLLIFFGIRAIRKRKTFRRFVCATLSVPMVIYILFVGTYATGYQMTPLADRLSLREAAVTEESLLAVAEWAGREAASLSGGFPVGALDESEMPYSWQELTEKLNDSYAALSPKIPYLQNHRTALKPILLSDPMTYTGIVGVYSFFTGESNINTTYPDYSTVFTAAHEMAHQRGIAPENEANFVAFLVLINASDSYLRYAGYMNLLDYLGNAIYATNADSYGRFAALYNEPMKCELRAYSKVYYDHQYEPVRDFAGAVNDTYLKGQGTAGTVSYSLVVRLAVRYYETEIVPKSN